MSFEKALNTAEELVLKQTGKSLNVLQQEILKAAWNDENYQSIITHTHYSYRHIKDEASKLWKLLTKGGVPVKKKTFQRVFSELDGVPRHDLGVQDWGMAPDSVVFGRSPELTTLKQWIVEERCRLVALVGMGGIGKTDLSLKLARAVQHQFEYVIWRSLLEAPPLSVLLRDIVKLAKPDPLSDTNTLLGRLFSLLQERRCLVILDNIETIFQGGARSGQYREGYEEYGKLLDRVGSSLHQSCFLLTSREKPHHLERLAGKFKPVRFFKVDGLDGASGRKILQAIGDLTGSEEDWRTLIEIYQGNPLALELVAHHLQDAYFGNIAEFLRCGKQVFDDLNALLHWHFVRLSEPEREILYWLAINREPVSLTELRDDILSPVAREKLSSTLQSLQRRMPIVSGDRFTLQPVLIEYVTEQLVEQVCEEIHSGRLDLLNNYALMKAQAKDYVKAIQAELILQPIVDCLTNRFKTTQALASRLKTIIAMQQREAPLQKGYLGGNTFNLCCQLRTNLTGYSFANLTMRQADFQGVALHHTSFAHCDLSHTAFTQVFGSIVTVAMSPCGGRLAAGDATGNIHLWQFPHGKHLHTFGGHTNWVRAVQFSPDGRMLGSGSSDNTVRLWSVETGRCITTLCGHTSRIWDVAFSPDGKTLLSGSHDGTIRLWHVSSRKLLKTLQLHSGARSLCYHPSAAQVLVGTETGSIEWWDVDLETCLKKLPAHAESICSISVGADGKIVTGGSEGAVKVWDTHGRCLGSFVEHTGGVEQVSLGPDGKTIASASDDQTIKLWSLEQTEPRTLIGHTGRVQAAIFSPDGRTLISGSNDQTIKLWNVATERCSKTWQGYTNWSLSLAFSSCSASSPQRLASGSNDRSVRLWDVRTGECLKTLTGHYSQVQSLVFSPDGRWLASGSENGAIKVWDLDRNQCLHTLSSPDGHTNTVWMLAFSPDGQTLVSGSGDGTIRLWAPKSGECLNAFANSNGPVWSVAYSPDGSIIASGSDDGTVTLWSRTGDRLLSRKLHRAQVFRIAFCPHGQLLSCGNDSTVKLLDIKTGKITKTVTGFSDEVLAVSTNEPLIVSDSSMSHSQVHLWSIDTGQRLRTLTGHTDGVWSVIFSGDGLVATTSRDETIRVWDVSTGECLKVLRVERLYEHMDITNVKGLTEAQKGTLKALGAVET